MTVPDDRRGKAALTDFSKAYGKPMLGIQFDPNWPAKFDLADPFPTPKEGAETDHFYRANKAGIKVYVGPTLGV